MVHKQIAPYGAWKSPISAALIVSATNPLGEIATDASEVFWSELRLSEGGRNVIVRQSPDGRLSTLTPSGFDVRTRVHEYGGAAYTIFDRTICFSNGSDGRVYIQKPPSPPNPLTPKSSRRYADFSVDRRRRRIFCICEDHASETEPVNKIMTLAYDGPADEHVFVSGYDFYASPRISPDGKRLAWLSWNMPNMPWDGNELWVGGLDERGRLVTREKVAGSDQESIFQPQWSPDGNLYFVSDRSDWWNIYRWGDGHVQPLIEMPNEFGRPQWLLGMRTYALVSSALAICTYSEKGMWHLASLDLSTGRLERIESPYTDIWGTVASEGGVIFCAASPDQPPSVVRLDLSTMKFRILHRSSDIRLDTGYLSLPAPIQFKTSSGQTAYGFFYSPRNRIYEGPPDERPPLLVRCHGGPTSSAPATLSWDVQYWTSRGFAVADVNYRGSTGYGRKYRMQLKGRWGIVDVEDCVNAVRFLIQRGDVNPGRTMIRGGSAGGFTALCALVFHDVFKAGASYYGVSNLELLAKYTHKFERRYLNWLVGPYPEQRELYIQRSPIHHLEGLSCPVIFFQGLEDPVVPSNQTDSIVQAIQSKGLPVAYLAFEGEQHGFRQSQNIQRALEAELYFYSRVFGFELPEIVGRVPIKNLDELEG